MSDEEDEFDFELPPLPSKPQKTLLSFFGSQQKQSLKKKEPSKSKDAESLTQKQAKSEQQPKEKVERSTSEVHQTELKNTQETNGDEGESDIYKPCWPPFPNSNHTQQFEKNDFIKLPKPDSVIKTKMLSRIEVSSNDVTMKSNFQSLLSTKKKESVDMPSLDERKYTIGECLKLFEINYPEFPVKKVFQQYLNCQKTIINSNLARIEASAKAINNVWKNDAIQLSKEKIEKKSEIKEKEKRDIRNMFTKVQKKKKSSNLVKIETQINKSEKVSLSTKIAKVDIDSDEESTLADLKIKIHEKNQLNRKSGKDIRTLFSQNKSTSEKIKTRKNDDSLKETKQTPVENPDTKATPTENCQRKKSTSIPEKQKKTKKKVTLFSILNPNRCTSNEEVKTSKQTPSIDKNEETILLTDQQNELTETRQSESENQPPSKLLQNDLATKSRKRKNNIDPQSNNKRLKAEVPIDEGHLNQQNCSSCENSSSTSNETRKQDDTDEYLRQRQRSYEKEDSKPEQIGEEETSTRRRSSRSRKIVATYCEDAIFKQMEANSHSDKSINTRKTKTEKGDTASLKNNINDTKDIETNEDENDLSVIVMTNDDDVKKNGKENDTKVSLIDVHEVKSKRPVVEIEWNPTTMNSFLTWTEKYQPLKGRFMIGEKDNMRKLFDWLNQWKEKHEAFVKKMNARLSRRGSKNKLSSRDSDDSDDWSDEDDEDYLCNTLLISGPTGCGTTAAVYACAKQIDYKVFELNPSMCRTGKFIVDQVSEAVMSHQVHKGFRTKSNQLSKSQKELQEAPQGSQQLAKFFRSDCKNVLPDNTRNKKLNEIVEKDAMSLVLFEEVDILFEELDRGFWSGIEELQKISRRPIILTANDESVIDNLNVHEEDWIEQIRLQYPSRDQILPMIQLICLTEQVYLPKQSLIRYCEMFNNDVRKIMTSLQFWLERVTTPLYSLMSKEKSSENIEPSSIDLHTQVAGENVLKSACDETNMEICENNTTDESNQNKSNQDDSMIEQIGQSLQLPWKEIEIPMARLPLVKPHLLSNEEVLNIEVMKTTLKSRNAGSSEISLLSSVLDHFTEFDIISTSFDDGSFKDQYPWSGKLSDSLLDTFPKEKQAIRQYPIQELLTEGKMAVDHVYQSFHPEHDGGFQDIIDRMDDNFYDTSNSVIQRQIPTCYRNSFYMDTFPTIKNMCFSEDLKRTANTRRNNRRFLHYFDSIGMVLEDETKALLATGCLPAS